MRNGGIPKCGSPKAARCWLWKWGPMSWGVSEVSSTFVFQTASPPFLHPNIQILLHWSARCQVGLQWLPWDRGLRSVHLNWVTPTPSFLQFFAGFGGASCEHLSSWLSGRHDYGLQTRIHTSVCRQSWWAIYGDLRDCSLGKGHAF